jgi:hypothetical protein
MPLTIEPMSAKDRLRQLVDELSDAEAADTLHFAIAKHDGKTADEQDDAVGRAIAAGYERIPQTDEEDAWVQANAREALRKNKW